MVGCAKPSPTLQELSREEIKIVEGEAGDVKLPNAENAVIAQGKLCDYLLNPTHLRGGSKAKLLIALGYSTSDWQRLEADLRGQHLTEEIAEESETDYGTSYVIVAPLNTPSGRVVTLRSVWQIDTGTDYPRLITMYPE